MGKSIRNFAAVTRVGLDLAKKVFQVHAVDARGEVVAARKLRRGQLACFLCRAGALRGGDGGLLLGPSLGASIAGARARGEADPARAREARSLPSGLSRGSGATRTMWRTRRRFVGRHSDPERIASRDQATGPAVRAGALDRQPGRVDASPDARALGRPAHGGAQRLARPPRPKSASSQRRARSTPTT